MRTATLLVLLMFFAPFAQAIDSPYIGDSEIVLQSNGDGTLSNLTEESFEIPVNSTILDGWVNVSTGANGDGGTGQHWIADNPSLNFSHGEFDDTSISVFEHELTLGVNHTVGRLDDLESLSLQFQEYTVGGSADVWRMAEPSQFNGAFAMNYSARQAAGGLIPSLASDGSLIAATLPVDPLPAGTHAWLTSPSSPVPSLANHWKFSFNHWYHLHHTNQSSGSSGAWVEVSLDGGVTWNYVEPIGGYNWNISSSAPIPAGANGAGFGVFGGPDASGWVNSTFDITHLHSANATAMQHRFIVWTDPTGTVDRPGWYVDEVTISNDGETPGSWFHGSLTGEYAADAHAHLTIPIQLNTSSGTSGAWMVRYWTDFDLEGGSWDKFEIRVSSDNVSWHRMSPVGGIPGPNGLTVGGQTIMEDTGGWIEVSHPFPSSFTIPSNGSLMLRISVETDQMPSSGYGGSLDPPEGVFIDDMSITRTQAGTTDVMWFENFTTNGGYWHGLLPGGIYDQWQYLSNWGNNGPWERTWSFEGAPSIADGWHVQTPHGQAWEFGAVSNASGWGPSSWPSGQIGVAMGLDNRHAASSWSHLISPSYHIPAGASARVSFDHFICAEPGWDGGALYTSVDNGTSWQIYGQDIPLFYDVQHWNNAQSPLYQKWVWDGSNQKGGGCSSNKSFTHVEGDLSSFGGQDVMLRFSFFSDTFIEMDGWYIDDVGVIVDWFESNGSWTSGLILDNPHGFAPTIDVDASVPDGAWLTASLVDANGDPLTGTFPSDDLTFPVLPSGDLYRIRVEFGTTDHQLTPRIIGLHSGAVRILNTADATNGWDLPHSLAHDNIDGNLSNPTLNTVRISGSAVYGDAPIEEVTIITESAGALYQLWDGQGTLLASGMLNNQSIVLPHAAVNIRPTIDLQPGGWVRYASFTGHLGAPMNNGSLDVGGDGIIDWTWDFESHGAFGWFDGSTQNNSTQSQWGAPQGTIIDQGMTLYADADITWVWSNGVHDSMEAGQLRVLEYPWTTIQNQSEPTDFIFNGLAISWESTDSITGLGSALRDIQSDAVDGTGPATISSGNLQIPIVLEADQGGVALTGSISHAQRIVNEVTSVPSGTMVPDENVTIVTHHSHLFDRGLLDAALLRLQTSEGLDIEVHIDDLSGQPIVTQVFGSDQMSIQSINVQPVSDDSYQIEWNLQTQWTFDDQDWIRVLAETIESDGFTLGPGHAMIGGSNHQAMENDLEVISWEVRDEQSRLLTNTWDARYPLHAKAGSTIDVSGVVRFEGQANQHPSADAYRVALELETNNETLQSIGLSGSDGHFEASIDLPMIPGNVSISPWILQIGPSGTPTLGAEDASGGSLSVEIRVDSEEPSLGPLMIHTPEGGQLADGNILSPDRTIPFWIEVHDDELLQSFVNLRCWFETYDDVNQNGIPDDNEYGESMQFLGGVPRGTIRVDFPAVSISGMEDGDRISCYIEGSDFAGYSYSNAGGPGFDNDLATMVIENQQPTQVSLPSITLNRHEDMALLQGIEHTFSFTFQDGNGLNSIDLIEIDVSGDGQGIIQYYPLQNLLTANEGSSIVPLDILTESLGDDAYRVDVLFAIDFHAPEIWLEGAWIPSLRMIEDGELVSSGATNLEHLAWALDNRLMWNVDQVLDLTAPSMPAYENRLSLQPDDSMYLQASVSHRETNMPLAIQLPTDSEIQVTIEGGSNPYATLHDSVGVGFSATIDFGNGHWPGPIHMVQFGLANKSVLNSSLPDMIFEVAIDDVAPRIEFQSTSLVQLRSDSLSNQLVAFTIEDEGGMGNQPVELHWTYHRDNIGWGPIGEINLGLGVHSDGSWVYSTYVDFTPMDELQPGDILLVWVEGEDLAGNALEGPGTYDMPRVPALEIMHFTPELLSIWTHPPAPEVGQSVRVDVRISNLGNLGGNLTVGLWAWESRTNTDVQVIDLSSQNISLDPRQATLATFQFEAWREGDLQVYLVLDENESSRVPIDLPPIREEGASLSWFERVFGDGPIIVSFLILVCTALGFGTALLWLRDEEDETDEEWDGDEHGWPEPPEEFPDETPPPIPPGLGDVDEEEE